MSKPIDSDPLCKVLYKGIIQEEEEEGTSNNRYNASNISIQSSKNRNKNSKVYIQELIEQVKEETTDAQEEEKLASISPEILASEELLTKMIDDVQSRLNKLTKKKKKELKLNLQTLKSALVAERAQLTSARLDSSRYEEEDHATNLNTFQSWSPEPSVINDLLNNDSLSDISNLKYLSLIKEYTPPGSPTSTSGATIGDDRSVIHSPYPSTLVLEGGLRERMARQPSGDNGNKIELVENLPTELKIKIEDNFEKEAIKAEMVNLLSEKKFVAFAYCSWCFKQTIHGRVQRNLLRRSRYKCTECSKVTLKCRAFCGNMARGHNDYDEELCAKCDGTINEWGEDRPFKMGYCSSCFHYSSHYLMHRGYVLHDTYRCSYCKNNTFLCATCQTDFGTFESNMVLISELLHFTCAKCSEQIQDWENNSRKSNSSFDSVHRKVKYVHPHESFAEVRSHISCEVLIDGKQFFDKSFKLINDASDTIFMSCWWLSPFIYLKRSEFPLKEEDRLCNILWKKADEGVQIYIIIWNNSLFLSLCSEEAKEMVEKDHPNIHIMRDPSFSLPNFLWSHHQKFTCIDFTKAIVGGLDYAVGRYDTPDHDLIDLGLPDHLKQKSTPSSPYHKSLSPHFKVTGASLGCISPLNISPKLSPNLNISNPNFLCLPMPSMELEDKKESPILNVEKRLENLKGMRETLTYLQLKKDNIEYEPQYLWPGIDYYQPQDSRPENYNEPLKDIVKRFKRNRMPWHDVSLSLEGLAAYDVAVNFIERWNHHRKNHTFEHLPKLGLPKPPNPPPPEIAGRGKFSCEVQIVRSLCDWSGLQNRTTEASVYGSYISAISKAQHYIYIENQYVVSSTAGGGVENRIIVAILDRIKEAIKENRKFKVFIMFPIPEETGKPANHMLQLSYQTLFRGGLSLLDQFKLEYPELDPFNYIGFYFLRTYSIIPDKDEVLGYKCVTDMVFVHSKIMIIDDEIAIIASNNLNDRSMLGNRDSELGAVILDTKTVHIKMDGKPFIARKFAYELRVKLWREHLGLIDECFDDHPWTLQLKDDPICDSTYHDIFRKVAALNTNIYKQVFPHIPSNEFNTFQDWLDFNNMVSQNKIESPIKNQLYKLNELRGTLCFHPTRFCHFDSLDWSILEDIMGNELVS